MAERVRRTETVPGGLDGERIDRAVSMMAAVSRSTGAQWVAEGHVRRGDEVVTNRSERLVAGDQLSIDMPADDAADPLEPDADVAFEVVHVDDQVIVVDKPAGLVVHPGAGTERATLVHGLLHRFPELAEVGGADRPGIVHRLDGATSGLLMVARTPQAYDHLVEQLTERSVLRRYDTLVWGAFDAPAGRVEAPIGRSRRRRTRMAVVVDGRQATTDYEVVRSWRDPAPLTQLSCRLHTGRTHQIRVHLSSISHPVVGDDLYGGERDHLGLSRLWLHAASLGFEHPSTGEHLEFAVPLPPELVAVLDALDAAQG